MRHVTDLREIRFLAVSRFKRVDKTLDHKGPGNNNGTWTKERREEPDENNRKTDPGRLLLLNQSSRSRTSNHPQRGFSLGGTDCPVDHFPHIVWKIFEAAFAERKGQVCSEALVLEAQIGVSRNPHGRQGWEW